MDSYAGPTSDRLFDPHLLSRDLLLYLLRVDARPAHRPKFSFRHQTRRRCWHDWVALRLLRNYRGDGPRRRHWTFGQEAGRAKAHYAQPRPGGDQSGAAAVRAWIYVA